LNLIQAFLQSIETKAYKMAYMATKKEADALDLLQNAMMKLVEKYSDKPESELKPLFYAILQNQIKNWYRQQAQISKWFFWQKSDYDQDESEQELAPQGIDEKDPEHFLAAELQQSRLLEVLEQLPVKQQQCFLLRSWEGLSVKETAKVMNCSEGSVKTHMSRASQKLQQVLAEEE
jgi:RNA polymerase sigma-70 factor (ECF subfamily)